MAAAPWYVQACLPEHYLIHLSATGSYMQRYAAPDNYLQHSWHYDSCLCCLRGLYNGAQPVFHRVLSSCASELLMSGNCSELVLETAYHGPVSIVSRYESSCSLHILSSCTFEQAQSVGHCRNIHQDHAFFKQTCQQSWLFT